MQFLFLFVSLQTLLRICCVHGLRIHPAENKLDKGTTTSPGPFNEFSPDAWFKVSSEYTASPSLICSGTSATCMKYLNAALIEDRNANMFQYQLEGENTLKHFDAVALKAALHDKTIVFHGDSRLRSLFSSFVESLAGDRKPQYFPNHRICPGKISDDDLEADGKCAQYFRGGNNTDHDWEFTHDGVQAKFLWNAFAADRDSKLDAIKPDIILVNNGAWSVYGKQGFGWSHMESDSERINLIEHLSEELQDGKTTKVWVMYPDTAGPAMQKLATPELLATLARHGWLVFDTVALTSNAIWYDNEHGKVWHDQMMPVSALPTLAKRKQISGVHTWDTVADLEMQILYNNLF